MAQQNPAQYNGRSSELVLNGVEQHGRAAFTEWQVRLPWRQYRCVCDVALEEATGNDEVQLGQQTVNVVSQCVVLQGDDALLVKMLTHSLSTQAHLRLSRYPNKRIKHFSHSRFGLTALCAVKACAQQCHQMLPTFDVRANHFVCSEVQDDVRSEMDRF